MNYGENFHNNGHQVESNLTVAIEKDKLTVATEVVAALNEKLIPLMCLHLQILVYPHSDKLFF